MLQENNRTEFKAELNDKLEKEIVAFLNNREGGVLYIGVDDEGKPVGVPDLDGTQLKIADRIKNNILPSTLGLFDIVSDRVDNVPVIKVLISSGLEKPYYITCDMSKYIALIIDTLNHDLSVSHLLNPVDRIKRCVDNYMAQYK